MPVCYVKVMPRKAFWTVTKVDFQHVAAWPERVLQPDVVVLRLSIL